MKKGAKKKQYQPPVIFAGRSSKSLAKKVAKELDVPLADANISTFSDSETRVVINTDTRGRDVYIIQSSAAPANENLMELLLLVHAVKAQKPKRITVVAPFIGYRRQEKVSLKGESLSFELVARLLRSAGARRILTIDLHKHRSARFFKEQGITCKELRVFPLMVEYFKKKKLDDFVILAPDKGSLPEAQRYAKALKLPLVRALKHRSLTKKDSVTFDGMEGEVRGKNVLIIDDEVNTAGTLVGVVKMLKKQKARMVYFACTHAVLSGPAIERLKESQIKQVVVTDTIYHPKKDLPKKITTISVAPLFAEAIAKWSRRK
jgi:ribose-phosphate pyrophosphokinase